MKDTFFTIPTNNTIIKEAISLFFVHKTINKV